MVRIKICGITNLKDAMDAAGLGADALGFIFAPSPRQIEPARAKEIISKLPPWISTVGVFVNEKPERIMRIAGFAGLDMVQLHGEESPEYCAELGLKIIKAVKVKDKNNLKKIDDYNVSGIILDTYDPKLMGGTGKSFNWNLAVSAKKFGKPVILSGGLTPDNVSDAIKKVKPYGVDVSTGIEFSPGKKDFKKMKKFIDYAKSF